MGSIFIDNNDANESISKSEEKAEGLGSKLAKGIGTAAKWGAAIGGAAIAGAGALLGMATKSSEAGDRVDKLSQKIGMSRQGFQEWDYILGQNGMSIESLQGGMKRLVKNLDDAKTGSATAVEAFDRIGLSVEEIQNMSPEEAFDATVKALQAMPEGAEKAALANELLGRSGSELMPLLNGTTEDMEALRSRAHDLGLVMSDEAVTASAVFGDTLDDVKSSMGMVVTKVGLEVMPIIQSLLDWVLANMPLIQSVVGTVFGAIGTFVQTAGDAFTTYLLPIIQSVIDYIVVNWPMIQTTISNVLTTITGIITGFVGVVQSIWAQWGDSIMSVVQVAWTAMQGVISGVTTAIQGIIQVFTSLVKGDWQGAWDGIKTYFQGVWEAMKSLVTGAVDIIKNVIKLAWDVIKSVTSTVWEAIKSVISSVWESIKSSVSNAINSVKSTVENIWNAIKTTTSNIWNGIKSSIDTAWNNIKSGVSNAVDNVKSKVSSTFENLKSNVQRIWDGIKSSITKPIESARDAVRNAIDRMKGFFNFSWSLPRIKLPHFNISGKFSLNPPQIPRFSVDWYKEGAIFNSPTLFNTPYGLKGVGEAGPEAVLPIEKLPGLLGFDKFDHMIELLKILVKKESNIYLDGDTLVGELIDDVDKRLADKQVRSSLAYGGAL